MLNGIQSMQTLTTLPETGVYMSSEVRESIYNMKGCMMGFDFAKPESIENTFGYDKARNLNSKQDQEFGITQNGSSFVNLFGLMIVLAITIPLLNLVVILLHRFVAQNIKNERNWVKISIIKVKEFMFFHFYIKLMMLIYLILMFSAFPEIHDWARNRDGKTFSRIFAVLVSLFCVGVLIFAGWYWYKYAGMKKPFFFLRKVLFNGS